MSGPRRTRNNPAALIESENSVWDVYNNLADIRDYELIKDWNDSLNFLLLFAAIFAAVLTALIVESMKLLQQDPQDTTNAILLYVSSQLANNTMPAYQSLEFQVPQYAVVVNALLFASLCCSLVAALAAVLALQWVNEYDARLDIVDSEKRALIKHFRFVGVGTWKMAEIIAFLPLLLHSSVFLFFAGIITWLRNIHLLVYWICVTGTAITAIFYIITTGLAATFGSSPFRSPMARVFRYVQFTAAWHAVKFWWIIPWSALRFRALGWRTVFPVLRDTKMLEESQAEDDSGKLNVLIWTVYHVELATQSTHRLLQILKHAIPLRLDMEEESPYITGPERRSLSRLWRQFLKIISETYIEKAAVQDFSAADLEVIRVLLSSWKTAYPLDTMILYDDIKYRPWRNWSPVLRLIGPLSVDKPLQTAQQDFVVAAAKAMWLQNKEQAAKHLVETIRSIGRPATPQDESILSYSIDCLSTFLWTHGNSDAYREAANFLAEMVAVPPGRLFTNLQPAGTIELTLSAIYSAAFNYSSGDARRYWASGHRLHLASELGNKSGVVQALHFAVTSHVASEVAHATEVHAAYEHLHLLCRLMAYTPFETVCGADAARASSLMENMAPINGLSYLTAIAPALASLVWLPRLNEIPRIYEYLEVLLSCRQQFPSFKPAWRDWLSDIPADRYLESRIPLYGVFEGFYEGTLEVEDIYWLDHRKSDRQIVEVFRAFDRLLERGHSAAQHLVLVQLLIDDLSEDDVTTDDSYYTDERKASLKALKDPVLRLIGARAAGIAYSGPLPLLQDDSRRNGSWVEALRYWCGDFEVVDAELDEGLIVAVLSQPNPALYTVLQRSSSQNAILRDKLCQVLESRLNEPGDVDTTLLLHTVAQTASWFPEYMTPVNLAKAVEIVRSNAPSSPRVLPFLAFLAPLLSNPEDLKVITTVVLTTLSNCDSQSEANEIYSAFGGILQDPPHWMQALQNNNFDRWREVLESMRRILDTIRTQEDSIRAVLRWNGRPHPVWIQGGGDVRTVSPLSEISPQEEGAGNQDHDRTWLERPYSCAACWNI